MVLHDQTSFIEFRSYSWSPSSDFGLTMRQLFKYLQSMEDEHFHIYAHRSIDQATLRDYSSAIQEIIPRLAKVQSIINHNTYRLPDLFKWTPPDAEPLALRPTITDGAQECQEFATLSRQYADGEKVSPGTVAQAGLACQAGASKSIVAIQRGTMGAPVCDPRTVQAGIGPMGFLIDRGRFWQIDKFI